MFPLPFNRMKSKVPHLGKLVCRPVYQQKKKNASWDPRSQKRLLSTDKGDPASNYLSSLGYDNKAVQEGMKAALKGVFGNDITADNLKNLGVPGKLTPAAILKLRRVRFEFSSRIYKL